MTFFSKLYDRFKAAASLISFKLSIYLYKKNKPRYSKFLIVCGGRTGSNMLVSYLNSHPNIVCYREVFHLDSPKFGFDYDRFLDKEKIKEARNNNQGSFLRNYIFRGYNKTIKSVGFKLIYWQAASKIWNPTLIETIKMIPELKIIHLVRKNKINWLLSGEIARMTNKWIAIDESGRAPEIKISITPDDFKNKIEKITQQEKEFEAIFEGHQKITIYYEDIITNPEIELAKIQDFIRVPVRKLSTKTVKQISQDASEILSNYSELKNYFKNTEYGPYFNV